jgi:hypothetical protein
MAKREVGDLSGHQIIVETGNKEETDAPFRSSLRNSF